MLRVFKSLPVVTDVVHEEALPAAVRAYALDTITLGWEERLKARGRRCSDNGVEFGTALARGTILRGGDCFIVHPVSAVIVVVERPEPVLVIEPRTRPEWGLFAYHIGNSHQPLMILADAIVCPDVPGMQHILEQHAISFSRDTRPFTPVGQLLDHRHPS
jgi:urease accessory protein